MIKKNIWLAGVSLGLILVVAVLIGDFFRTQNTQTGFAALFLLAVAAAAVYGIEQEVKE